METQNDMCFASATSSPSRCSIDSMFFYSAPTSPTRKLSSNALLGSQTEPTSPRTYEDSNSILDDFEFDINMTSKQVFKSPVNHRSRQEKQHKERGDSLPSPTMAFADELFCDGKVMPLAPPLKLPPSIRGRDDNRNGYRSYTATSSPRSPRSVLRLPLSRQSLWNDDFDPFMVALENVKEEKRGNNNHRRARSMSPLRVTAQKESNGSLDLSNQQSNQMTPEGPIQLLGFNPNDQRKLTASASTRRTGPEDLVKQVSQSPTLLAEPKGLMIARQLEKMSHEKKSGEPDTAWVPGPEVEETSEERKRRVSKRQRLKKFLLRSFSSSRVNDENKAKNENVVTRKPSFMRRFTSFKSKEHAQNGNGEERVSDVAKMALAHYRPSFSICLGYRTT